MRLEVLKSGHREGATAALEHLKQVLDQSTDKKRVLLRVRSGNFSQYVVLRSN